MKDKELKKIADRLQELDWNELRDSGLKSRNGGFAKIDMYDHDDDYIYVEIVTGIQCGSDDDYSRRETGKLDRKTLEWASSGEQILF